jgi:hypothetical protein
VLLAAGILVDERAPAREQAWQAQLATARAAFADDGFAPLAELIHPFHVGALRRYYRCRMRRGHFRNGDNQVQNRYAAYQEPATRFFHHQLRRTVSAIAGEELIPSYCYVAGYRDEAELSRHIDRAECAVTVSLCIDYSPEPTGATSWPLFLDTRDKQVMVLQRIGDALIYRGCELPHYRHRLNRGETSTSILFHYVREDFIGPLF